MSSFNLKINIDVDSIEKLDNYINYVQGMLDMTTDNKFQEYIREKCLETLKQYAAERLSAGGTSNEEYYSDYIESIEIPEDRITNKGFEIISNLVVQKPDTRHSAGYDFSISLAFEYGTGIIGMGSADAPSWYKYNVNNNTVIYDDEPTEGWWIPASIAGGSVTWGESRSGNAVITRGYEGMEIFRFGAAKIQENLQSWVTEYLSKNRGVSND